MQQSCAVLVILDQPADAVQRRCRLTATSSRCGQSFFLVGIRAGLAFYFFQLDFPVRAAHPDTVAAGFLELLVPAVESGGLAGQQHGAAAFTEADDEQDEQDGVGECLVPKYPAPGGTQTVVGGHVGLVLG